MEEFKIKVIGLVYFVKPDPEKELSGSIIIPETAELPRNLKGVIVACGDGGIDKYGNIQEPKMKVGDRVLFGVYAGQKMVIDNVIYFRMREEEIYGVLAEGYDPDVRTEIERVNTWK